MVSVTIEHRFGGHRGRATEWEISTPDAWAHENFSRLPDNPAVWVFCKGSPGFDNHYAVSLTLDEGNPESLALEMVSAILAGDFERLLAAHQKAVESTHTRT